MTPKDILTKKYYLGTGTVQCVVSCVDHFFMVHFGHAQYSREIPILTDSIRKQAQPIVDKLNEGAITEEQAELELKEIYW